MKNRALTDRAFICPGVIHLVIPDSLRPVHCLVKHHELHLLLLDHLLLYHATVHAVLVILSLVHLTVIEVILPTQSHRLILLLDHASTSIILKVTLLLVGLDGNVSIDTVEVLLLLCEHFLLSVSI